LKILFIKLIRTAPCFTGCEPSFDHLGPMASNVTDVAKLLEVIAGYDDGRDHRQNPHVVIPKYSQLVRLKSPQTSITN